MRLAILAIAVALPLAGPAAAEIRLWGDARMGLTAERDRNPDRQSDRGSEVIGSTRLQAEISRETDSGVRLGVTFGVSDNRLPHRGPRD